MSIPPTYVDYTATAAQTDFAFSFEYLEDEHVTVFIDGAQQTLNTDFTIVTTPTKKIVLTSGATAGQIVRVRRQSQRDTDLVDFENGSVLTERELDRAYQHNRYLHQEIGELNDASLQKAAGTNNWDAGNNKIVNVATPTDTNDASTKDYVDSKVSQVSTGASSPPNKYVFTGTAGANTTYSVTGAEVNGDTAYDVSIDGAVQEPTTDFTVDPDTDTLTIIPTLSGGEDIVVIERGFGVALTTGNIDSGNIANDAIVEDKIADDAVTADKIADDAVTTDKIADDSISLAKMKANSVDSDQYVDGSIDRVHLAADIVDGTKIADDSIDSEHYVDGSIDSAHINTTDPVFNVQTNGRVGIGTASPAVIHHISTLSDSANYAVTRHAADSQQFDVGVGGSTADITGVRNKFYIFDSTLSLIRLLIDSSGNVTPGADDAQDFGSSSNRWDDIYATNTTIQSSDRELKQDIDELTEAETRVARACKGLLRKYRWKDAVAQKGDEARIHFGIIAQDLEDAFTAEGLDAGRYGMFVKNTWWTAGTEIFENSEDAPEGATEVTQRGVRYSELLAFIIAAM